jgi:hypothetical protein
MPIPNHEYERDLAEANQKHSSIICRVQIIKNANLRTTVQGDARVDAERQIKATRAKIQGDIDEYCAMVRALAGISS